MPSDCIGNAIHFTCFHLSSLSFSPPLLRLPLLSPPLPPKYCPILPEELIDTQAFPLPGEAQGEGEEAVYLAGDGPSLQVVPRGGGGHHNLRCIWQGLGVGQGRARTDRHCYC